MADPSGLAVYGVGLRPLGCWSRGFESSLGMDVRLLCLYVVLSCVGRGLCDGLITVQRSPTVSLILCVMKETHKGALCSSLEPTQK
jgi:hypothetical protein